MSSLIYPIRTTSSSHPKIGDLHYPRETYLHLYQTKHIRLVEAGVYCGNPVEELDTHQSRIHLAAPADLYFDVARRHVHWLELEGCFYLMSTWKMVAHHYAFFFVGCLFLGDQDGY